MHYIYLNTYNNGFMYVGSHTWSGEGLDPSYHGSSKVANRFGWSPIKEEILEVVSEERKFTAERSWILTYCNQYGIADCALHVSNAASKWGAKFKQHGLMLNLHANGQEALLAPEAIAKSHKTHIENGAQKRFMASSAAESPEAQKKSLQTRLDNGTLHRLQYNLAHDPVIKAKRIKTRIETGLHDEFMRLSREPETCKKRAASMMRNHREVVEQALDKGRSVEVRSKINHEEVARKISETRRTNNVKPHYHKVAMYQGDILIMIDNPTACCKKAGNKNWAIRINKLISLGHTVIEHHGYRFILQD